LKIAIVVNGFPEISETFIINKVLALAANGNEINVIRLNGKGNENLYQLYKFDKVQNLTIIDPELPVSVATFVSFSLRHPVLSLRSFSPQKRKWYQRIRQKVYQTLFNNSGYDVVHFEYSGIAASLVEVIETLSPKTVVSCRGSAEKVKLLTEPGRKEKIMQVFNCISAVHCVSEDMRNTIAPFCTDLQKTFVNRPAIDASFFTPPLQKEKHERLQILSIGRFTYQKGYLPGLMAIKELAATRNNFVWNIIGDGPQYEEVLFHIHNMQLEGVVNLLGKKNKDEVNRLLSNTDIFLLTSVYEGIPNVVLEAMAMELPVVATRSGGVDEVITHGKNGFVAELYDVHGIAALLKILLQDDLLRQHMGKEARERILSDFTLQRQAALFQKHYEALLKNDKTV